MFEQTHKIFIRFFFKNQQRCFRLVQHIFDLFGTIAGIDRHHDGANAGEREIDKGPFGVPCHPDCDFVALGYSQTKETARDKIRSLFETIVRKFSAREDIPDLIAVSLDRFIKRIADGFSCPLLLPHGFTFRVLVGKSRES